MISYQSSKSQSFTKKYSWRSVAPAIAYYLIPIVSNLSTPFLPIPCRKPVYLVSGLFSLYCSCTNKQTHVYTSPFIHEE